MTTSPRSSPDSSDACPGPRLSVVHVIVDLERGGAERMLERLVLDPTAHDLMEQQVVSLGSVGPIGLELRERGIAVHTMEMCGALDVPMALYRLRRLLQQLRPNVVQTWMYHADLLGGVAAWSLRIPVVWGVRTTSLGPGNAKATRVVRWTCAALSRRVPDAVIFVAQAARRSHEAMGYVSRTMRVVPNGFEIPAREHAAQLRDAWRLEHGLTTSDVVIGWVGRFNPDKDVHAFVKAAATVTATDGAARIAMVGRGLEHGNEELLRWIETAQPREPFLLLGETSDATACFCGFDIFALSSRNEAFPNVVAEAMATGLPCVVTDVGDVRFLVDDAARVVDAGDVTAMAHELLSLVSDLELRESLGQRALHRVSEQFSMAACVRKFHKVYQEVLAARTPS